MEHTIKILKEPIQYYQSALEVYNSIQDKSNTLLLESAEINTKTAQKSLLIHKSCLRIEANDTTVECVALTPNGTNVLNVLKNTLPEYLHTHTDNQIRFVFPKTNPDLEEKQRIKVPNVLEVLRTIQNAFHNDTSHDNQVFIAGVFSFDLLGICEELPMVQMGQNTCPDYVFYLAETLIQYNHIEKTAHVQGTVFGNHKTTQDSVTDATLLQPTPIVMPDTTQSGMIQTADGIKNGTITSSKTDDEFCDIVEKCQDYITKGDAFQIVPSRVFSVPCTKTIESYATLKHINPSPYMFYIQDADFCIFGASPESALKYTKQTNTVTLYPIAGTRPRGKNSDGSINTDLDSRLELEMRMDSKETSEHIMLVDLARNDIARISVAGSRNVSSLMHIDKYSHVQHIVSQVDGQLKPEYDCLNAYQLCMNMGTLTGAPKIRATEIIREVETTRRGSYGGAIGYINNNGDMDTCITIRSAYVQNGIAHIAAGAGVVLQSDPTAEAEETSLKAQSVITAITLAHRYNSF